MQHSNIMAGDHGRFAGQMNPLAANTRDDYVAIILVASQIGSFRKQVAKDVTCCDQEPMIFNPKEPPGPERPRTTTDLFCHDRD